jgi:pimeloyl-ACP methyl ester carboxylesterase
MPHSDSRDNTVRLGDGRLLGYAEYGDRSGQPVFYVHGHPGSRLEAGLLAAAAARNGVRLIGVDQPGLGLSTYQPRRTLLDWPDDVVQLAHALDVEPFAVVGFSGGGPHALACAYKIPEQLTACAVVSGVGRSGLLLSALGSWLPWVVLPLAKRNFVDEGAARKAMARVVKGWPEPDRKAFELPAVQEVMVTSLVEGFRQGIKGAACEGRLISARQWGFAVEDIHMTVRLWHGELDDQAPAAAARQSAQRLPKCEATFYPADAHISTIVNHADTIIETLAT